MYKKKLYGFGVVRLYYEGNTIGVLFTSEKTMYLFIEFIGMEVQEEKTSGTDFWGFAEFKPNRDSMLDITFKNKQFRDEFETKILKGTWEVNAWKRYKELKRASFKETKEETGKKVFS